MVVFVFSFDLFFVKKPSSTTATASSVSAVDENQTESTAVLAPSKVEETSLSVTPSSTVTNNGNTSTNTKSVTSARVTATTSSSGSQMVSSISSEILKGKLRIGSYFVREFIFEK